jgi:hypothetical protein
VKLEIPKSKFQIPKSKISYMVWQTGINANSLPFGLEIVLPEGAN